MNRSVFPWNALIARAARVGKTVRFRGPAARKNEIRMRTENPRELLYAIEQIEIGAA